ncbi:hypothetical protein [Actinophytocola sp.]|uniref:hypothetical protein n=1 Tax=Actinophytocola sp. TaxID=1872138 RepID=UPI002D7EB089|nr:hypothetical protein [Actinophytocola sp.]HET9137841.1 hypothetical protein [Actinophytocola sp.]
MTDDARSPLGPPWSVDVLADLHAGVLDPEQSARLWPAVNADPEARAVLAALDSVKVGLGRLGAAPVEPMPAHFAARLDAALAAEAARTRPVSRPEAPAPVTDLAQARRRRNRGLGWAAGVLTAAAAAVAVTVTLFSPADETGNPVAAGPQGQNSSDAAKPPLQVNRTDLSAAIGGVSAERDYGPLKNQSGLEQCLQANKVDPAKTEVLGVRQVNLEGKPGIMVLLSTGEAGRLRVLIVEPTCDADNPAKLVDTPLPSR